MSILLLPKPETPSRIPVTSCGLINPLAAMLSCLKVAVMPDKQVESFKVRLWRHKRTRFYWTCHTERAQFNTILIFASFSALAFLWAAESCSYPKPGWRVAIRILTLFAVLFLGCFAITKAARESFWDWKRKQNLLDYKHTMPVHLQEVIVNIWEELPDAQIWIEEFGELSNGYFALLLIEHDAARFYIDGWRLQPASPPADGC